MSTLLTNKINPFDNFKIGGSGRIIYTRISDPSRRLLRFRPRPDRAHGPWRILKARANCVPAQPPALGLSQCLTICKKPPVVSRIASSTSATNRAGELRLKKFSFFRTSACLAAGDSIGAGFLRGEGFLAGAVPRCLGQHDGQAADVGEAGENQARADEGGQQIERGCRKCPSAVPVSTNEPAIICTLSSPALRNFSAALVARMPEAQSKIHRRHRDARGKNTLSFPESFQQTGEQP